MTSSLLEVAADAAIFFPPNDQYALASAIEGTYWRIVASPRNFGGKG